MFERGPQFNNAEQKPEVKEGPEARLKNELKEIALALQKDGVPVDGKDRIDVSRFEGIYSKESIAADKEWTNGLKEMWKNRSAQNHPMSWLYGKEQIQQKLDQRNPLGETWEMLATKILHENLGKDFIVVRTSKFDDIRYNVDNLILDKKTNQVVCAFDEVGDAAGKVFNEKKNEVFERNWLKGGADIKYGISFEGGKVILKKGIFQIPLFYFALSEEEINKTLKDPHQEKNVFSYFIESARKQIKELEAGPAHGKLRERLNSFKSVLEKL